MEQLTQTISNLVGILLGVVGAIGVGFFIYGAYLYLTASGAPHQMERGKSAMMTALAGIVLALVAYGVVELVMNAVVDPGIDIDDVLPEPEAPDAPRQLGGREKGGKKDMREHEVPTHVQAEDRVLLGFTFPQVVAVVAVCALSYGAYRYAPIGPSEVRMALAVLFGLVGIVMVVGKIGGRRLPLVAADLLKYRLGARLYAGQIAQLGEKRAARAGAAGEERPRPPEPDGETRRARAGKAAQEQEDPQEQGAPQRAHALVRQAQGEGRREGPASRPPVRDAGDEESEAPHGLDSGRGPGRPDGGCRGRPAVGPCRRPLAGRDRLRGRGTCPRTPDIRRGPHRLRRPRRRHPAGRHRPGHPGAGLRRAGGRAGCASGVRQPWPRGSASTTRSPSTVPRRPSPCPGRTPWDRPGR